MYRIIACLMFLLLGAAAPAHAQRFRNLTTANPAYKLKNWHGALSYIGGYGFCSYYGDLKDNRIDLWAKPSTQLGLQYRYNDRLHFRSELVWYRISGADSLNSPDTGIYDRNLSFRADNFEWNAVALLHLFNKYSRFSPPINAYAFAGLGLTTNTPKAYYQGEWHKLRPLQTEGVEYGAVALVIPFGGGVAFHLSKSWDIYVEYGYRITFTDYLDDVSTVFKGVDNFDDPLAAALSDRRPEMGLAPLKPGQRRGNSGVNDWYLIAGVKLLYTPSVVPKAFRAKKCKLPK